MSRGTRGGLLATLVLSAVMIALSQAPAALPQSEPPAQPLPYSHKTHVGLGLKCKECHANPEPGELMTFPATSKCMACHQTVKKDSEAIQRLAEFAKNSKPVPWARVYQVPGFVFFSHRVHTEAGATCEQCHGPVAQRDALWKEADTSMGSCMECHRVHKASNDCSACHELRQ